jgi:hypothetical protein
MKSAILGLAALATIASASTGYAAVSLGPVYIVSGDTGDQSFGIAPESGFVAGPVLLGEQSARLGNVAFNPSLGSLIDGLASITIGGQPFKVIYSVEGYGNEMVFSDTVTATAEVVLNGKVFGTPEVFNVNLSSSCGGPGQPDVDRFCSTKDLLSAFSGSQVVALPPGESASSVQFVYLVTQSNENCVENYYTGSVITTTSACTDGGTSIVDTADIDDPAWNGSISIAYRYRAPEPASLGLLAAGLGLLVVVRKRRA